MSSENMVDGSEPDGNDDGVAKKEETASTNKLDGSEPDTADDGVAKRESGDNGDDAPSGTVEKREPRVPSPVPCTKRRRQRNEC